MEKFLLSVKKNLLKNIFSLVDNDLYQFYQIESLRNVQQVDVEKIYKELTSHCFTVFIRNVTGLEISNKLTINSSLYLKGNVLLVHDDQVDDRKLAFILYLVDLNWSKNDGGSLDIFISKKRLAYRCIRSFLPLWNSMLLFEVSTKSFHQVAEMLSRKKRLTIAGWWHENKKHNNYTKLLDPSLMFYKPISNKKLCQLWLNQNYLKMITIKKLNKIFVKNGVIEMYHVLKPTLYDALMKDLKNSEWSSIRSLNKEKYDVLRTSSDLFKQFIRFIKSRMWKKWLRKITLLKIKSYHLHCKGFIRGSYSLLHDLNLTHKLIVLDVTFTLYNGTNWNFRWGGYLVYVDQEKCQEIISSKCEGNKIILINRNSVSLFKFLKYINYKFGYYLRVNIEQSWR